MDVKPGWKKGTRVTFQKKGALLVLANPHHADTLPCRAALWPPMTGSPLPELPQLCMRGPWWHAGAPCDCSMQNLQGRPRLMACKFPQASFPLVTHCCCCCCAARRRRAARQRAGRHRVCHRGEGTPGVLARGQRPGVHREAPARGRALRRDRAAHHARRAAAVGAPPPQTSHVCRGCAACCAMHAKET